MKQLSFCLLSLLYLSPSVFADEMLRRAASLESQLKATSPKRLADDVKLRGDAVRGALVFFKSPAACVACHTSGAGDSPLGPNLAKIGKTSGGTPITIEHIVESLLFPSRHLREGYETHTVLTDSGEVFSGLIDHETEESLTIRLAGQLTEEFTISKETIEAIKKNDNSMMPDGLVSSLANQREFLDLVRYVYEVAIGGEPAAQKLRPSEQDLIVKDDTEDLDHAGIIKRLRQRDFEAGEAIYHGYCFNCHGHDGNTPSLPTARAFGTQKLKFGADPYSMFMTLTKGNGLMAPMSHLTPKERYQVVHYIQSAFMKDKNEQYVNVTKDYLAALPVGHKDGTEIDNIERDFGPALGSQLRRDFPSVLSVRLGDLTIAYDLHSGDQADIWNGGFLDLSQTQHVRPRGEGTANPEGKRIESLAGWRWGHDGSLDYSRDGLLPRGPLPKQWYEYHGHYLHDDQTILHYSIDGREIYEKPSAIHETSIQHYLEIGPGKELILCIADDAEARDVKLTSQDEELVVEKDHSNRIVLRIPSSDQSQLISVACNDDSNSSQNSTELGVHSLVELTRGGPLRWPETIQTTGYLGLQQGGYVVDTITIPETTPWNTWFRTSALDFFSDGRMAVSTHGGDVWIVSGIDDKLTNLEWKRFASGLYEPFGLKIVNDITYVTCKDRITRLHDYNNDGEADFYECFNPDPDVSCNFHAFNFDLQTDDEGNFYHAKSGHGADFSLPGAIFKISADGKNREVIATGFRTPNGMGSMPGGRITASDNQGQWTPASKINLIQNGGFYGWVPTYSIPGMWQPDGGKIDIKKVVPPTEFDPPLVWMPQHFDNSSGGEIWVDDLRFGPLSEHLLHTSFGKGWLSYLMIQTINNGHSHKSKKPISQAAIVNLPFDFNTGIMRGRVNPMDGQVYVTGLQGWNGGGRMGLADKGIQRLRYTGQHYPMVIDCKVIQGGLKLTFNFEPDENAAVDINNYAAKAWNYNWSHNYGSDRYSPTTGEKGVDEISFSNIQIGSERKNVVTLFSSEIQPVDQLHLVLRIKDKNGKPFEEEIYWTINAVPR